MLRRTHEPDRQMEEENARLCPLVADLFRDTEMLQEVIRNKL